MLTWMKSWDHFVFGKELNKDHKSGHSKFGKQNAEDVEMKDEAPVKGKNENYSAKKRKRDFKQNEAELEEKLVELDEQNRPKTKVALLSGPPGLGESSTCFHIQLFTKHLQLPF